MGKHRERRGRSDEDQHGSISEGGSAALDPETSFGGADSVPDTPDVNTEVSDAVDINESREAGEAPSEDGDEPD